MNFRNFSVSDHQKILFFFLIVISFKHEIKGSSFLLRIFVFWGRFVNHLIEERDTFFINKNLTILG